MIGIVITYGLLGWALIGSLFRPAHGFAVYAALAVLRPQYLWSWALPSSDRTSLVAAIGMAIGWVLHLGGDWRLGRSWWGLLAFVSYLGWAYISSFNADAQYLTEDFLLRNAKVLFACIVGVTSIRTLRDLQVVAWTIVIAQTVLAYYMNDYYFTTRINMPLAGYGGMGRAVFGVSLVMTLTFCMGYVLANGKLWVRGLALISAALIGHTVMLTYSRGAMLELLISGAVLFYLIPKQKHTLLMTMVLLIAVGVGAGGSVMERFNTIFASKDVRDASAQSRFDLWANCLVIIAEEPVLGIGPDHFPTVSSRFGWEEGKEAHNLWLQTAAEIGIPGLIFLLLYYLHPMYHLYRIYFTRAGQFYPHSQDPVLRSYACMSIASVVGFFVAALFVTIERLETPYYIGVIALATLKLTCLPAEHGPIDEFDEDEWIDEEQLAYAEH